MKQQHDSTKRFGGPGASHENAVRGTSSKRETADTGQCKVNGERNPNRSAISGGGGERDSHHTHDPRTKS
jgi:hypothetical protein